MPPHGGSSPPSAPLPPPAHHSSPPPDPVHRRTPARSAVSHLRSVPRRRDLGLNVDPGLIAHTPSVPRGGPPDASQRRTTVVAPEHPRRNAELHNRSQVP